MKTASVRQMKAGLEEYLAASGGSPVVITKNGKPIGALLPVQDKDDLERLLLAHSPKLNAIFDRAHERIRQGEGIPHDQFWAEVEALPAPKKTPPRRKSSPSKTRQSARVS
ncbi:MAG TPA: type II toxin-antitoxin system Phd/YefM family antitoxin [Planctomycetaceae bacterium]|nr:type II toxin-antitoxin system Phd/YefM family antitoxin [Planctomycetaceae bacterium]